MRAPKSSIYKLKGLKMYKVIEKKNPLAVHCLCDTLERAQYWINTLAPRYCQKGYFMDKTLTPNSFTITEKKA